MAGPYGQQGFVIPVFFLSLVLMADTASAGGEVVIESQRIRAVIDGATSRLLSLHDKRDGTQILRASSDRYKLETQPKRELEALEGDDEVVKRDGNKFVCRNPRLGGLTIEKEWFIEGRWLTKRVTFSTNRADLGFLKYSTGSSVNPEFYRDGYLNDPSRHPLDYPYIFVKDLKRERQIFDYNKFADHHLVIFTNPTLKRGIAQYRLSVDGRFVQSLTGYSYEPGLFYSPEGWRMAVAAQWLTRGKSLSCEVRWHLFDGDHVAFHREYINLPQMREQWGFETPEWARDVRAVMSWVLGRSSPRFTRIRKAVEAIDRGYIMVTIGGVFHNTRNYLADPIETPLGIRVTAVELRKVVDDLHAISPRIKVGPVTWQWGFGELDPVFREHPEWTVHNGEGKPVFATTGWSRERVYSQLLTPECRDYVLSQFRGMVKRYDFDFIYMDSGQGGVTRFDWRTKRCAQDYDWAELYHGIRLAARSNRNGIAFFNGTPRLYSIGCDCGYFEGVGFIRVRDWRALADRLFLVKLYQPDGKWTIPLYWRSNVRELYANYCLALALKPQGKILSPRWCIAAAAEELRDARLAPEADMRPCWWREQTDIEAYALKFPRGALLTAINHSDKPQTVTLSCDLMPFGFDQSEPLHIWEFTPRTVKELEETVCMTEAQVNELFRRKGVAPYRAIASRFVGNRAVGEARFELDAQIDAGRGKLFLLTQSPTLAYAVDGRPTHFLLPPPEGKSVMTVPADRPLPDSIVARREEYVVAEELKTDVFVSPHSTPEKVNRHFEQVGREINGVKVRRFMTFDCEHNSEDKAGYDVDSLTMRAEMGLEKIAGFATSGVEADNLGRVKLKVSFTPPRYNLYATQMGGCFAGFVCDYHTQDGYVRRVFFPIAPYGQSVATSSRPWWGVFENKGWSGKSYIVPLKPKGEMVIDLGLYAPREWDGRAIFGVALESCGYGTRLEARIIENGRASKPLPKIPAPPAVKEPTAIALFQDANIYRLEDGARLTENAIAMPNNALVEGKGFGIITWKIKGSKDSKSAQILVNYKLTSGGYRLKVIDISKFVPSGGEGQFDIDLNQYAPEGWSGKCRIRLRGSGVEGEIVANSRFQIF